MVDTELFQGGGGKLGTFNLGNDVKMWKVTHNSNWAEILLYWVQKATAKKKAYPHP